MLGAVLLLMKIPTSCKPFWAKGFSQVFLKEPDVDCSLQQQEHASVEMFQLSWATLFLLLVSLPPLPPPVLLSVS